MKHIFLIGFMGAGKSTVARILGRLLSMPVIDLDRRIEERSQRSIPEIFEAEGEARFRALESAELSALAEEPPSVVACGGGIVLAEANREELHRLGTVVYLRVSADEAARRVGDGTGRPLLSGERPLERAAALLSAREPVYAAAADIIVETFGRTPEEVAGKIADEIAEEIIAAVKEHEE